MMVEVNQWQGTQVMRNTAFREVHKNAWLKMVLVENKKRDKMWVVFCVHDDTDPFLEAYVDNKVAATHKPHWYMSLNNTLHITPTICPQDEEYEFVITLQTDVIRLTAPSWQLMIDWVETLRRKLLEMRILSPKENVYSKLPVTKNVTLLPTRDPTSPLPLPPTEPAAIVPGVEPPPVFNYDIESTSANHSGTSTSNSPTPSSSSQTQPFTANSTSTTNEMAAATINPVATSSAHYEQLFLQSSANKVAVLKRAQRSVSNCEIPQNALQGGSTEPVSLMRRRSNSLMETNSAEDATNSGKRLTLRAQQVSQLQKEIMHPGGVRLRLRRRDCVNSIALVDACSGVWIAGWKQREHPMLYNALHIGDQLVSVEGVAITKASDAHRILRNASTGLFVELVVKRLPFGQVYAIRRDVEGQCLGLVQEDGSAVLKDVLPDGLAARHGLFPKAQTMDGLSLTNWVLTEINGRPLNLFFKDNEVRDRLNSVGRDISILVQPLDLIKQLKKQLKSMRNYKDYLLQ